MDRKSILDLQMPATYGRHLGRELPPAELWRGTGVSPAELEDMDRYITVRQLLGYAENMLRLAPTPDWHFGWAARLADHFHGPVSVALQSAPTLGDGFDTFLRFFPARIPYMHMEGRSIGERYAGTLHPLIDLGCCMPLLVETPLIIVQKYFINVFQVDIAEARLDLAYPPTAYADRYAGFFGCPVQFDQPHNALLIPQRWRGLRNFGHSPSTWAHALAQCEQTLVSSPERNTLGQVRRHLAAALESGPRTRPLPTLAETAEALHMSQRTLMRRLTRMGTAYQQLIDELLKSRACELLAGGGRRVKEVAAALGFDNPANFAKAFKRWSGVSPRAYGMRGEGAGAPRPRKALRRPAGAGARRGRGGQR